MRIHAEVTPSGSVFAVSVPEVPGAFTQAASLEEVPHVARAAVADLKQIHVDHVEFVGISN